MTDTETHGRGGMRAPDGRILKTFEVTTELTLVVTVENSLEARRAAYNTLTALSHTIQDWPFVTATVVAVTELTEVEDL